MGKKVGIAIINGKNYPEISIRDLNFEGIQDSKGLSVVSEEGCKRFFIQKNPSVTVISVLDLDEDKTKEEFTLDGKVRRSKVKKYKFSTKLLEELFKYSSETIMNSLMDFLIENSVEELDKLVEALNCCVKHYYSFEYVINNILMNMRMSEIDEFIDEPIESIKEYLSS